MNESCPNCGSDLRGEPIPQEYIDKGYYEAGSHYNRILGIEIRGVYDGVLIWECPDCGFTWPRFDAGRLYIKAKEIINAWATNDLTAQQKLGIAEENTND